jgi:paired amphipathic helix protein Sin3a
MGIQAKQADKKHFAAKHLVDAIKTKHEEQRRQRSITGRTPKYQFSYEFSDHQVITDVLRFMVLYASNSTHHNSHERRRISEFFEKFVTHFFELSSELVADSIAHIDRGTPDDEDDDAAPTELPNGGRGRRQVNGKKNDLRRGVLDKGRNGARVRVQKEGSTTGSKESTPDVESLGEDESAEAADDQAAGEVTNDRWATAPPAAMAVDGSRGMSESESRLKTDQPYKRDEYALYCNQTVFVFFSIFQALYSRLKDIKESEHEARDAGNRAAAYKPAQRLGLLNDRGPEYALPSPSETYYSKALLLIEEYLSGDVEDAKYQDWLRRHYLRNGWTLYTIVDLLKSLCRLGATCSSVDAKEKTPDLIEQFYINRQNRETTFNLEINMRKQADRYIKDGELFVIYWVSFLFLLLSPFLTCSIVSQEIRGHFTVDHAR